LLWSGFAWIRIRVVELSTVWQSKRQAARRLAFGSQMAALPQMAAFAANGPCGGQMGRGCAQWLG
jgi:hypothetical protein